jgi:hypothetical protein
MTVGFSSCRFTKSVDFEEALGNNTSERHSLNYSIFISSKNGTGILIFWISFPKLKEDGYFKISLTSRVGSSIKTREF